MNSSLHAPDDMTGIIQDQADRLFRDLFPPDVLASSDGGNYLSDAWSSIEAAGLPLAAISEDCGGIGLPLPAVAALVALSAYHACPLPLAETIVAQRAWTAAGGTAFEGSASIAPVNHSDCIMIEACPGGFRLTGSVRSVPWGDQVGNVLLSAANTDGTASLVLLPDFLKWSTESRNLAGEARAEIVLTGIVVPSTFVLPVSPDDEDGLYQSGAMMRAFQMVGAMRRAMDLSVQYVGDRVQFGKPLAKFQAIQQALAEAAGHLAAAEAACARAASGTSSQARAFFIAAAKARTSEAAGRVAEICHQVHGAIGFTKEYPLHYLTRRLWSWRDEFGNETYWQEVIGHVVCADGGDALWPRLTAPASA